MSFGADGKLTYYSSKPLWLQPPNGDDVHRHKYRGPIPEARTKYEAEQAELKSDVTDLGKYGEQFGTMLFTRFAGDLNAAKRAVW